MRALLAERIEHHLAVVLGADPRDVRAAAVRMLLSTFAAGGIIVLLQLPLAGWHADPAGLAACLAAAALAAAVTVVGFDRLHTSAFPLLLASGTLLIMAALGFAGDAAGAYAPFCLWVAVAAYGWLPRHEAHLQTALAAAAYGLTGVAPVTWAATIAAAWVAGLLVQPIRRRRPARPQAVEAQVHDLPVGQLGDLPVDRAA